MTLAPFDDHEVLGEAAPVVVEPLHLDRPAGPAARRQEAVAEGHRARADLLHERAGRRGGAKNLERDDPAAVHEQHPADRPAAQQLALAVVQFGVPAHLLRVLQIAQRPGEHGGQHVDRRLATQEFLVGHVHALGRLDPLQCVGLHALLAREAETGAGDRAVGGERRRGRRAHHHFLEVGLALGHPGGAHHQPPRRAEGLHRRLHRQPLLGETRLHPRAELRGDAGQPARWQLLGADLDQQLSVHGRSASTLTPPRRRPGRPRPRWRPRRTRGTAARPAGARAGCRRCAPTRRCCRSSRAG